MDDLITVVAGIDGAGNGIGPPKRRIHSDGEGLAELFSRRIAGFLKRLIVGSALVEHFTKLQTRPSPLTARVLVLDAHFLVEVTCD